MTQMGAKLHHIYCTVKKQLHTVCGGVRGHKMDKVTHYTVCIHVLLEDKFQKHCFCLATYVGRSLHMQYHNITSLTKWQIGITCIWRCDKSWNGKSKASTLKTSCAYSFDAKKGLIRWSTFHIYVNLARTFLHIKEEVYSFHFIPYSASSVFLI